MDPIASQAEWEIIENLLPAGWEEQARQQRAFRRVRYTKTAGELLRLLLFHVVHDGGLRQTVAQARLAGLTTMSSVALSKRLCSSRAWLSWMAGELARQMRQEVRVPEGLRPRILDSTTIQGPGSRGTEWRLHYTLDLQSLVCDWLELTDAQGSELLERPPIEAGDVILADRNFLRHQGVRAVRQAQGHVLVRMRWVHSALKDEQGRKIQALDLARRLRAGQVGDWPVALVDPNGDDIAGRLVVLKLPAPLARKAEERAVRRARKKGHQVSEKTRRAAHYIFLFTTLPTERLQGAEVLELYRFRWQIELAFKRLKQILQLGQLPHQNTSAAQGWIAAKMVVALLLETLYRKALTFSPWGYELPLPVAGR
jgi:DDE family transposase